MVRKPKIPDVWLVKNQTLQKQVLALQKVVYKRSIHFNNLASHFRSQHEIKCSTTRDESIFEVYVFFWFAYINQMQNQKCWQFNQMIYKQGRARTSPKFLIKFKSAMIF